MLPKILIAGVGNIFLGDDGFGVEVVARLASVNMPENVRIADFGIRSFDLAYALQDGYDLAILVDAMPRGQAPGTLYTIEPDIDHFEATQEAMPIQTHGMDPANVLRMSKVIGGGSLPQLLIVGCEPAPQDSADEDQVGLSMPVQSAIPEAVNLIQSLVQRCMNSV
jgi:hydrogenase maturation protease